MQLNYATQVNKLINILMKRGKKNTAKRLLFNALLLVRKKTAKNPIYILRKALVNSTPILTFIPTKRGSRYYNIPAPITERRANYLAASWIINGAAIRKNTIGVLANKSVTTKIEIRNTFANKLCEELIEDANGIGDAAQQKQALYSIVIENRPFMRY